MATKYKDYKESDEVRNAKSKLERAEGETASARARSTERSNYASLADDAMEKLLNRDSFSYSTDSDPLYEQYKKQYSDSAESAMKDTMGRASALTGGYGNSYAQTAGNDAYNREMSKLDDIMPTLYEIAYERYKDEGNAMSDNVSLLRDFDETDYERRRNAARDSADDRDYYAGRYENAYSGDRAAYESDRAAHQAYEKQVADENKAKLSSEAEQKKIQNDYDVSMAKIKADSEAKAASNKNASSSSVSANSANAKSNAASFSNINDITKQLGLYTTFGDSEGYASALKYLEGIYTMGALSDDEFKRLREVYIPKKYIESYAVVMPIEDTRDSSSESVKTASGREYRIR